MENNDATKAVLNVLEKKVRNLEKRKVSELTFEASDRTRSTDGSTTPWWLSFWHVFLAAETLFLFAGKAWFVQEAGGRWANTKWRSEGAFWNGQFFAQLFKRGGKWVGLVKAKSFFLQTHLSGSLTDVSPYLFFPVLFIQLNLICFIEVLLNIRYRLLKTRDSCSIRSSIWCCIVWREITLILRNLVII